MKFCKIFLFITIAVSIFSIQSNGQYIFAGDETDDGPAIPIDYLGNRIYGLPNDISGERVANWNPSLGVNPEELGTYAEGDILFSNPTSKSAYASKFFRWRGAKIPYKITGRFTRAQRQTIMTAINDFHKYTCLRFVPQTNEDTYIRISSHHKGCYSSVGHTGQRYDVNLQTPQCVHSKGTVIHELMHAAGFIHEQSRGDRDDYVTILRENIEQKNKHNFYHYNKEDLDDFGVPYDYNSIMHYSRYTFSKNGRQTIIPKPYHDDELGQRHGFSKLDVEKINRMYQCKKEEITGDIEQELENRPKPQPKKLKYYYHCNIYGQCWLIKKYE